MQSIIVIKRALELFPERNEARSIEIKFSRAFKGYNANCAYTSYKIQFRLSYIWKGVSDEIIIGLLQELFNRIYKKKKHSYNIDMYNDFIKKSTSYTKTKEIDLELKQSFDRVNEEYFHGMIDTPNLVWGQTSLCKLGSYDFMTNSISISKVLRDEERLLDYVMYHEILHKKMQYKNSKGNKRYHTKEFREKEAAFNLENAEKKLEAFLKKKKLKKLFSFR
jgi:predicted metal-dependent hydrolase